MYVRSGIVVILLLFALDVVAQVRPRYSQYILNPFLYNPAFAAKDGPYELHLNHRRQWLGMQDAPVVSTVSLQHGFSNGMAGGISAYNYTRGLIQTNNLQLTIGYQAKFGYRHRLQMGLTGMITQNSLDYSRISNQNDPAIVTGINRKAIQDGQFGINYHLQGLNLGITLPSLMNHSTFAATADSKQSLQPLNQFIINADYRLPLSQEKVVLQPYLLYFATSDVPTQWEAGSMLYLHQKVHIGGAYRQDNGATAMAGFAINKSLALGYAYDFASRQQLSPGQGSHEIQLRIRFGRSALEKIVQQPVPEDERLTDADLSEQQLHEPSKALPATTSDEAESIEAAPIPKEANESASKKAAEKPVVIPHEEKEHEVASQPEREQEDTLPQKTFTAGNHQNELAPGYYMVAGVFEYKANALKFTAALWQKGYKAAYGYNSQTGYYYVYLKQSQNRQAIRLQTLKLRKQPDFRKAWMLHIEQSDR